MQNSFIRTCLLFFSCVLCFQTTGFTQIEADYEGWEPKIDALVADYTDLDIFSGVVVVAKDGEPFYQKAYGLADRERGIQNTLQTKFILGSMNKSFTAAVIGQLLGEGRLGLDDKLTDHLEGFEQEGVDAVRIRHLLEHSAGFGDYHYPGFFELPYEEKTLATVLDLAREVPLLFPAGEEQEYSNTGYMLLGGIIESVTSKSYAQIVRERITEPLGLTDTYLENIREVPDRSIGYMQTLEGVVDNLYFLTEPRPDGGFWATATDVLKFYRHFYHDQEFLTPAVRAQLPFFQMIAPYYEEVGVGLPLAGGAEGLNTVHVEFLKDGYSIVVLANMDEPVAEKIGLGIIDILKGRAPAPAHLPASLSVFQAYEEKGIDFVKANFDELTTNFHPTDPRDFILNSLGYQLMQLDRLDDALVIFHLNTELFPDVANVWDSLGEARLENGEEEEALSCYEKALRIDPDFPSALEAVERLRQ